MGFWRKMLLFVGILPFMGLFQVCSQEAKFVAITFDDGPSGRFTAELLEGLKERKVKATFFLCGYRVDQFPALTERIAKEGHEIGTHSDTHRFFSEMSPAELCEDLRASVEKLERITGQCPQLLRPPGGIYDKKALQQTSCADIPIILWSVDPDDWCCDRSEIVVQRVMSQVKPGDIILLHDMYDSSIKAALEILDRLQAQGYVFVTVSELANLSGTELRGGEVYYGF